MIFSLIILLLCSVTASGETEQLSSQTVQPPDNMTDSGDASDESQTTTAPLDVTNTETTTTTANTSLSTWLTQKSTVLTTSESTISALIFTEAELIEEVNSTTYNTALENRNGQDIAANPGLAAVLCIFSIVVAVVVVFVIVKAVRSRRPQFERLDDVSLGKISEDAPFARYPPK
ncbi:uncharacterized LOC729966 homolog precursor [Danio rerio]|uniref:Uncharacterized LOC729966 homolog precursor n=1 Tax=Danio rerio TaxID=7955 RepID=A0AB13ABD3_DANRE|nr:FYVE and coiled-coil domain-containing protein 1 precursor [Danio rerio]